jgi:hypothetical protein
MPLLPLFFLEEVLGGKGVDAFACVCDLQSPLDVVFIESKIVYHSAHGTVDWVLDLGPAWRGSKGLVRRGVEELREHGVGCITWWVDIAWSGRSGA